MTIALVATVIAIGVGAVVAVAAREAASVSLGLTVALVGSALLADPLPGAAVLGVRVVAALLVAIVFRIVLRDAPLRPSPLGWASEGLLAAAGAVTGIGLAAALNAAGGTPVDLLGGTSAGPPGASNLDALAAALTTPAMLLAAAGMLGVLGAAALLDARPGVRKAIGLVLVAQAVLVYRLGVAAGPVELEEIARSMLLVACGVTGAAIARAAAQAPDRQPRPAAESLRVELE